MNTAYLFMRARGRLCVKRSYGPTDPKSIIPESGKGRGESSKALKEVVIDFRDPVGAFDLNAYLMLDHEFRELLAVD